MLEATFVFFGTCLVIAIGRLPGFRVDRTGAAVIGASRMIGFNDLTFSEAYAAINYDSIILLFGMMIGVFSGIQYRTFASALSLVAAAG